MNLLQRLHKRCRRSVPPLMGMLAVVWLGMVLQPCVMAAEMNGDCPHCPTPMEQGCGGGASEGCTYIDRVDYDGRTPQVKPPHEAPDETPVFVAISAAPYALGMEICSTGPPPYATSDLPTPSLNVLFCVYLN